jgi:hypothetical protein
MFINFKFVLDFYHINARILIVPYTTTNGSINAKYAGMSRTITWKVMAGKDNQT